MRNTGFRTRIAKSGSFKKEIQLLGTARHVGLPSDDEYAFTFEELTEPPQFRNTSILVPEEHPDFNRMKSFYFLEALTLSPEPKHGMPLREVQA